jgi:hypothetical protein
MHGGGEKCIQNFNHKNPKGRDHLECRNIDESVISI